MHMSMDTVMNDWRVEYTVRHQGTRANEENKGNEMRVIDTTNGCWMGTKFETKKNASEVMNERNCSAIVLASCCHESCTLEVANGDVDTAIILEPDLSLSATGKNIGPEFQDPDLRAAIRTHGMRTGTEIPDVAQTWEGVVEK